MGGGVAVHVAAARPTIVSLVVMAGGHCDDDREAPLAGQTEAQFVERGFGDLLEAQAMEAAAQRGGLRAAHLGITRLIEPRALHREAVSMSGGTSPGIRSLLGTLKMPRWYLQGSASGSEPDLQRDLAAMGVGWKVVPETGHAMGLMNPEGLAQAVLEALPASWES